MTLEKNLLDSNLRTHRIMSKVILQNQEYILCACGCGQTRLKYDKKGREYKFLKGHHKHIGRYIDSWGYMKIRIYDDHHRKDSHGYVLEHILVLEAKLGRRLNDDEVTHHINGIKTDNRPENLEVMIIGDHIGNHHKKNMIGRLCRICKTDKTLIDKKGYDCWFKYKDSWICKKCYEHNQYMKRNNK